MDFMVFAFSLAFLVWMIPVMQSGHVIVIAMLVLGVGTVFGPAFFAVDGPIQISLDRLLWVGMVALSVIGWRSGAIKVPQLNRMDWLVVGIVGWFFLSALRGGPVPTGSSPVARWLFYVAMPAGMYALARVVQIRYRDVRWMLYSSMTLGLYLAMTAMLEISGAHGFVFPRFIVNSEVWEFYGRGRGPLMNPSGNGFLMTLALVAVGLAFFKSDRRGKLLYCIAGLVMLGGVYATLTRSAWLGAVGALALICLMYTPRWVRVLGLATVVVLGGASIAGVKDQLIRMKRDKNLSAADAEKSMELRPLLAVVAWEMFKDRPIIGHGYGHYFEHNDPYHNNRSYGIPLEQARSYAQHNVFLSILVDTGLIGLALFVSWLAMLVAVGWQLARQMPNEPESRWLGLLLLGCLTAYFCNGMFQDVMIIPMVHMYLFFLAGIGVTAFQHGLVAAETKEPAHGRVPTSQPIATA